MTPEARAWMKVLNTAAVKEDFSRQDVLDIAAEYAKEVASERGNVDRCGCADRSVLVATQVAGRGVEG